MIPATPTLYGDDAKAVLYEMTHGTPDTPRRIAMICEADRIYGKYRLQTAGEERQDGL